MVGVDGEVARLTEAHEWDVCCVVSYSIGSYELCNSKLFYLDFLCIALLDEPFLSADFSSPK